MSFKKNPDHQPQLLPNLLSVSFFLSLSLSADFRGFGDLLALRAAVWLKHGCYCSLSLAVCVHVCVRVHVCDSFHTCGSSLLLWAASLAAIPTKPKALSLCLSNPQSKCPVFQSFLSIQLCNSIYQPISFSYFTHFSFHSSPFSNLFENIAPHPTRQALSPSPRNLFI